VPRRRRRRPVSLGGASKQDFNAVAAALCSAKASDDVVDAVAGAFGTKYGRFRRDKFRAAAKCGGS
jgi:hypothetical protein